MTETALDVAVVGGGHGAYAAAADLADRGHRVRLWRRDRAALAPIEERGAIELRDARGDRLPAPAQADVARALAPHLRDDQVVYAPPGSFGSCLMAGIVAEAGGAAPAFAEAGTLPYLARKHDRAGVTITARATRLPSGVLPANRAAAAFAVLEAAYPAVERLRDALDAALTNAGPVIHPPLILLNAAPIEHFDAWDIHAEGTQPSVRRVQDALDAERIAVREALGYGAPHYPLADHYAADGDEWMYGNVAHDRLVDSGDWREPLDLRTHRYMREDVACGLSLLVSLGEWAGVPTPVARGLLEVASALVGEDLYATGRTLEALGLAGCTREEMRRRLAEGAAS
jgi:opine dehydrogenase